MTGPAPPAVFPARQDLQQGSKGGPSHAHSLGVSFRMRKWDSNSRQRLCFGGLPNRESPRQPRSRWRVAPLFRSNSAGAMRLRPHRWRRGRACRVLLRVLLRCYSRHPDKSRNYKWLWRSVLSRRYSGSSTPQHPRWRGRAGALPQGRMMRPLRRYVGTYMRALYAGPTPACAAAGRVNCQWRPRRETPSYGRKILTSAPAAVLESWRLRGQHRPSVRCAATHFSSAVHRCRQGVPSPARAGEQSPE
jgi:hypothetical protein